MTGFETYRHVDDLWKEDETKGLDGVARLVYRSNKLGEDQRVTNTGGGNTSSKLTMEDPLTGEEVQVLWVKGSGGDLRTSERRNFASLYMEKLEALKEIYNRAPEKGVKTGIEDEMVSFYAHTVYNLNPRASSIDTPLHAFIPYDHVDHTHPNAVIAIAASKDQEELTQEIFGDDVGWVPWQRPGFDLGLVMERAAREHPKFKGLVMGQHGLINWADDDKACYQLSIDLIERAARFIEERSQDEATFGGQRFQPLGESASNEILPRILPKLRGLVSQERRFVGTVDSRDAILEFVNSRDAGRLAELGTSCPDHFLRTKIKPLYIPWDPQNEDLQALMGKLEAGLGQYRMDYRAYYERCKHPDSPSIRDPNPTVILIPGIGLIAWGKNKSESRVTAEFYVAAVEVMRGAEAISEYVSLPEQEAFDIEYWALEEAKLQRMPREKELARHVAVVVGAGSGIGRAVARRIAREGAAVVCADLDQAAAEATAQILIKEHGMGIGVAGSGLSGSGPAIGLSVDITRRESVRDLLDQSLMAYGGIDDIIITAGVYVPPGEDGHIPDEKWRSTFDVNVTGAFIVADEARRIWEEQAMPGSLVLTTSVNAVVPKAGSFAYDASKAAANHLVRELALELAPTVRVNGLAPATVVAGSSMFPRDRVIASLRKYDVAFNEGENTNVLREKLADYYAQRTLMGSAIRLEDQAEVAFLLCSSKFSKTTGQVFTVDGGLPDAFLR